MNSEVHAGSDHHHPISTRKLVGAANPQRQAYNSLQNLAQILLSQILVDAAAEPDVAHSLPCSPNMLPSPSFLSISG